MESNMKFLCESNGKFFIHHHKKPMISNIITEEKIKWQNVQNAEPRTPNQRKPGKWPEDQTKLANACNSKSVCLNAPSATQHSAKS
jgi:hypothetical protein